MITSIALPLHLKVTGFNFENEEKYHTNNNINLKIVISEIHEVTFYFYDEL